MVGEFIIGDHHSKVHFGGIALPEQMRLVHYHSVEGESRSKIAIPWLGGRRDDDVKIGNGLSRGIEELEGLPLCAARMANHHLEGAVQMLGTFILPLAEQADACEDDGGLEGNSGWLFGRRMRLFVRPVH